MVDVVCLGEILIDMVATTADVTLFDAPAFEPKAGGAPANVAVGVCRLGKTAAFVGKVGRDEFGQGLRRLLIAEGVDARYLVDDAEALTTLALVSLTASGDPHFAFYAGAHTQLQPSDIPLDVIQQARIFQCGSVMLAHEPARTTMVTALQQARAAGVICAYDVNWRPTLWPDAAQGLALAAQPLAWADICKMNATELRLLTNVTDRDAAIKQLATPAALVVVTLGAEGCLYRCNGQVGHVPAPAITTAIDATGAGDAFMAALLANLPDHPARLDEAAIRPLLRLACAAGTLAVTRRGAIPGLPTAAELATFSAAS